MGGHCGQHRCSSDDAGTLPLIPDEPTTEHLDDTSHALPSFHSSADNRFIINRFGYSSKVSFYSRQFHAN